MGSLMILYVTAEQETAVKQLFTRSAWMFQNLETFLSEDIKNEVLLAWELSRKNISNLSSTNKAFLDEHNTSHTNEITEDLNCPSKTDAEVTEGDVNRPKGNADEDNVITKNVNDTFETKPRKCKQNSREKKCKILLNSEKVSQKRPSGSRKLSVGKRTRKSILPDRDDSIHSKKAKHKQSDIEKAENRKEICSFKDPSLKIENKNFDDTIQKEKNINEKSKNVTKCKQKGRISEIDEDSTSASKLVAQNVKDEQKGLKCDKCSYRTNIRSNLNRHFREIHSGIRHKCSKCNKTFKGKHDAKMHDLYAHSSGLSCKECNKTFSSVSGLRNHVKIKHRKSTLYQCKHCEMKFYYKSHYLGHLNKHLNVKPFSCNTCQKPFRYKVACHLHEKTCSRENYYITHNADGSLKQTTKAKFLCDICGLALTSKSGLKLHHYYTHTEDTTTICSLCGKSFKGTYSLQRHMRNAHEKIGTVYSCPDCGKGFSQQQILKQHIKIHKKAYTCFCETCGKGFLSRFKMIEHTRMHTGEKPFSCPHCQSFKCATKTNLQKHMKIHEQGRVPRQKREQKGQKKKPKTSEENEGKGDDVKTDNYVQEIFSPLHVSSESYATSVGCAEDGVKYTNLPQMGLDNTRYCKPKYFSYDHLYKDQHDGNHDNRKDQSDSHCRLRTNYMDDENEYITYQMAVKRVVDEEAEGRYKTRGEGEVENNYVVSNRCESESQRNYNILGQRGSHNEICSEVNGFYSNDTTTEATELPQGLNILTVAMNIVNPSDY